MTAMLQYGGGYGLLFFGVLLCALAGGSFVRNEVWRDEVQIWEDVARKSPAKARGLDFLGAAYLGKADYEKAIEAYLRSAKTDPYYALQSRRNLARIYIDIGKLDQAIEITTEAIMVDSRDKDLYMVRGRARYRKKYFLEAIEDFSRAADIAPLNPDPYAARGTVYLDQGDEAKALREFDRACRYGRQDACDVAREVRDNR